MRHLAGIRIAPARVHISRDHTRLRVFDLADKLAIDPVQAAVDKLEKNADKYPVEQARGRADKYTTYDVPPAGNDA